MNTPGGVKRGSSVVELLFFDVSIPERGTMHKLSGEALYLDLGPGRRPLIALLTSQLHPKYGKQLTWSRDGGPTDNLLLRLYGLTVPVSTSALGYVVMISRMRGAHEITADDLPRHHSLAIRSTAGFSMATETPPDYATWLRHRTVACVPVPRRRTRREPEKYREVLDKVKFLEGLGLPWADAAEAAGSSAESVRVARYNKSKSKAKKSGKKGSKKKARARR